MPLIGDTGNLATFTLTTQTAVASLAVTKISIGEITLDMLDVSTLATTGFMEEIPSDLTAAPEVTIDYVFNQHATNIAVTGLVDTATITFPLGSAQTTTTRATFAGTGVVTAVKLPDFANGEVLMGQAKIKFDGDTGPTYTRGS
jgi:hypothetical protein